MRITASLAAALALAAAAALGAQRADSALVGSWTGRAEITVPWTAQRELAVRLDVQDDGQVSGSLGDARLTGARIFTESRVARAMRLSRQYAVEGSLSGALIRAEGVVRDRVRITLDHTGETLTGDLQTSGAYDGPPSGRILTATRLLLHRADRAIALEPAGAAAPSARVSRPAPSPR
jgi:hypothetical protein